MPRYDYVCPSCDNIFELKQSFWAEPEADCPACGTQSRRKFHAVPVIYKGSGFYTTDYARSNLRANGTGNSDPESETETEKPETKKEEPAKSGSSEGSKASTSASSEE